MSWCFRVTYCCAKWVTDGSIQCRCSIHDMLYSSHRCSGTDWLDVAGKSISCLAIPMFVLLTGELLSYIWPWKCVWYTTCHFLGSSVPLRTLSTHIWETPPLCELCRSLLRIRRLYDLGIISLPAFWILSCHTHFHWTHFPICTFYRVNHIYNSTSFSYRSTTWAVVSVSISSMTSVSTTEWVPPSPTSWGTCPSVWH